MEFQGSWLGANLKEDGSCEFIVWAPAVENAMLRLVHPVTQDVPMDRLAHGYYRALVRGVQAGTRYFYRLNGEMDSPDPASRFQPNGVHGPSEVIPGGFAWTDRDWVGLPFREYIIYELHAGTFTAEGTFDAIIPHLQRLKDLGITAIEIMPVAQFPGGRNWGYDGVGLFAVQNSYGGPEALKRLVNAAHMAGLAVILDVVYNHLGPEGNYLGKFGPYFTGAYRTPWGPAINFDGPHSNEVRRFFLENALYWQTEFHLDALRLDAVHAIHDQSAIPFLVQLKRETTHRAELLNRRFHLIAESDLNAPRFLLPELLGGYGHDAQWADDFHHCLHVLLTGEQRGYYADYTGGLAQFARVWRDGYAFTGQYSPYRRANHGAPVDGTSLRQFVVCAQNHDQVGNRMTGDRLTATLDFPSLKLAAAAVLLSPFTPLLFMGEEYGEPAPFQYFTSHGDPALIEAVNKGRRAEFAAFAWGGEVPEPQDESTFLNSRLNHQLRHSGRHQELYAFYRALITLRKTYPHFTRAERQHMGIEVQGGIMLITYSLPGKPSLRVLLNFSKEPVPAPAFLNGEVLLASAPTSNGTLAARSAVLLRIDL